MLKKFFAKYFKGDRVVWAVLIALMLFSLLAVYSSVGRLAYTKMSGNTTYFLVRHAKFLFLGFVITYIVHRIPYRYFSGLAKYLFYVAVPLLLLTLLVGVERNDAARWLSVPGLGIEFQTSDLAKLALLMYLARLLSKSQHSKEQLREIFKPAMIAIVLICGLILPANFSTAGLLFGVAWVLMYIGRVHQTYLWRSLGIVAGLFVLFVLVASISPDKGRLGTWKNRIESFVSGDSQENLQAEQSKIAIVSGGFFGKKPGNSTQRNFLPQAYSDFIYAIIVEEYGSLGGIVILLLYLYLLYRGGVIVKKCHGTFAAFLVIGLTLGLVFQALMNIAVAVNLFPVTGQTLPFLSMGGTSIMFSSVAIGIILSVSRSVQAREIRAEEEKIKNKMS